MKINASSNVAFTEVNEPKRYVITHAADTPNDCLMAETKQSKAGKPYMQYTLYVQDDDKIPRTIPYLMESQLKALSLQYGDDSATWIGLGVEVSTMEVGEFTNYVLKPFPKVDEEKI